MTDDAEVAHLFAELHRLEQKSAQAVEALKKLEAERQTLKIRMTEARKRVEVAQQALKKGNQ